MWAVGSAIFASLTAVLAKVGVASVPSDLATAIRTAVVLCFSMALVCRSGEFAEVFKLSPRTWVYLGLSGLATGCSWICYFRALQLGKASQVAPVDKLSVVFVIALASVALGEKVYWQQVAGGTLILAGAMIIASKPG